MELRVFPAENKQTGERFLAVEAQSVIDTMQFFEEFQGAYSAERVAEAFFALKRSVLQAILEFRNAEAERETRAENGEPPRTDA